MAGGGTGRVGGEHEAGHPERAPDLSGGVQQPGGGRPIVVGDRRGATGTREEPASFSKMWRR
jgi:hypothetical protein